MVFDKQQDSPILNLQEKGPKIISIKFKDIEKHIVQKAINIKAKQENSLFQFENLKKELDIESIDDLIKDEFLGDFDLEVESKNKSYVDIENSDKLGLVMKFLDDISAELKIKLFQKLEVNLLQEISKNSFQSQK